MHVGPRARAGQTVGVAAEVLGERHQGRTHEAHDAVGVPTRAVTVDLAQSLLELLVGTERIT